MKITSAFTNALLNARPLLRRSYKSLCGNYIFVGHGFSRDIVGLYVKGLYNSRWLLAPAVAIQALGACATKLSLQFSAISVTSVLSAFRFDSSPRTGNCAGNMVKE